MSQSDRSSNTLLRQLAIERRNRRIDKHNVKMENRSSSQIPPKPVPSSPELQRLAKERRARLHETKIRDFEKKKMMSPEMGKAKVNRAMVERLSLVAKERLMRKKEFQQEEDVVDLTMNSSPESLSQDKIPLRSKKRKLIARTNLPPYLLRFIKDTTKAADRTRLIHSTEKVLEILNKHAIHCVKKTATTTTTTSSPDKKKLKSEKNIQCTACTMWNSISNVTCYVCYSSLDEAKTLLKSPPKVNKRKRRLKLSIEADKKNGQDYSGAEAAIRNLCAAIPGVQKLIETVPGADSTVKSIVSNIPGATSLFSPSKNSSSQDSTFSSKDSKIITTTKYNFRIERNVAGIPGLHIAYDAFTEEVERRLFHLENAFLAISVPSQRFGVPLIDPRSFPDDLHRVINVVRDSGLHPEFITPDYCFNLTYTPGASFAAHRDSPTRWGMSICGVCLGEGAVMRFLRMVKPRGNARGSTDISIDVPLPRRCIYVMLDEARNAWKHAILKQQKVNEIKFPGLYNTVPPVWNPGNFRRSITLRSFRMHCEAMVAVYHPNDGKSRSEEMNRRIALMQSWGAYGREYGGKAYTAAEKVKVLEDQSTNVRNLRAEFERWRKLRFKDRLVNYPRAQYYDWGKGGRKLGESSVV